MLDSQFCLTLGRTGGPLGCGDLERVTGKDVIPVKGSFISKGMEMKIGRTKVEAERSVMRPLLYPR